MLSEEVKEAANAVGHYYLYKNHSDYASAEREILSLRISDIQVDNALPKTITVTTARPGLLIGKRGTNIDALEKFLGAKVKIIEDKDPLINYLIPHEEW